MFINAKCDRNNPAGNWSSFLHHSDISIKQFICNSSGALILFTDLKISLSHMPLRNSVQCGLQEDKSYIGNMLIHASSNSFRFCVLYTIKLRLIIRYLWLGTATIALTFIFEELSAIFKVFSPVCYRIRQDFFFNRALGEEWKQTHRKQILINQTSVRHAVSPAGQGSKCMLWKNWNQNMAECAVMKPFMRRWEAHRCWVTSG